MLQTQSLQTNINQFVKVRKRRATDELPSISKKFARKSDSLESNTPSHVAIMKESKKQSTRPCATLQQLNTEKSSKQLIKPSTPRVQDTKEFSGENRNIHGSKKKVTRNKKCVSYKEKLEKLNSTKSQLDSIKKSLDALKNTDSNELDHSDINVPESPVKCDSQSATDDAVTPVKPAAFEKYNHLLTTGKEGLILPYKYSLLEELFRWIDITCKIRKNRNEMITFTKLKRDMEQLSRKNFTESHLGQIKAVYPESYEFSRERIKLTFSNEEKYELIIKRLSHYVVNDDHSEATELTDNERLNIFHNRLLDKTKTYHQEFLSKLDPPLILDSDKLKLWHPEFDLDNVPDIIPISMPQPPNIQKHISAKAILEENHSVIRVTQDLPRAEENNPIALKSKEISTTESTPNAIQAYRKTLQKIPKALLEKIRAKEAAKMAQNITRDPAEAKEAAMLSRLPELARITRNIFVAEKKSVMMEEVILQKICYSYKEKLRINDILEHMKLIAKHVPGWITLFTIDKIPYIRLSKDADMTRVLTQLHKLTNKR